MPYNLEQFVDEWRKSEGTRTVQAEELRAEMARSRRTANRAARRLEKLVEALKGVPETVKTLREVSTMLERLKIAPTEMQKMNRRLTALVVIFALASLANPILASEAGHAMVDFCLKRLVR